MMLRTHLGRARYCVLATSVVLATCLGSTHNNKKIEFRVAAIENDVLGLTSEHCKVEDGGTYSYRTPSGREMTVIAAVQPMFTLSLDESVSVTFVDFGEIEEGQGRVVVADVMPGAQEHQEANRVRQAAFRCDLLLTIDGLPVDIERRGTNWAERVPGGTFASISEAERAYSGSSARISREVAPESERKAVQDFWRWRRLRDIWDFHCDSSLREYVRQQNRELYSALERTPPQDCDSPPEYEEPTTD